MKITNLTQTQRTDVLLQVTKVIYFEHYQLRITFSDGKEKIVDFGPFLHQSSHPSVEIYRDLSKFKAFKIVSGNIHWGDFDMLFPVKDLYTGRLIPSQQVA
ncbi:MAG: DUF2442 domain-containing protein [Bacteroidia bacterium]